MEIASLCEVADGRLRVQVGAGDEDAVALREGALVGGDQGIDHIVELLAAEDPLELVQGQVDAMVGHPALRKVISANALGAVARAHLKLARARLGLA